MSGAAALAAASTAHGGDDPARSVGAAKAAGEFDVCVVGGSCTGVFAAVRAAAANRVFPTDGPGLQVAAVAPELGLRESRHLCGLYRVTGEDVLSGREYPDVIAKGTYRVDIHEGKGIKFRYLDGREWEMLQDLATGEIKVRRGRWRPEGPNPECYQVPYRAIVPKGSENVLAAGRMLDADREAYGALRVMVNCNQMGEAAGAAAAKAVKERLAAPDAYPGFVSAPA